MLGVARECYKLAKKEGLSEEDARVYWLIGLLHDIGYEFTDYSENYADIGADILEELGLKQMGLFKWSEFRNAIRNQGDAHINNNNLLKILNKANLSINETGDYCTYEERLQELENKYGKESIEYINAKQLIRFLEKN